LLLIVASGFCYSTLQWCFRGGSKSAPAGNRGLRLFL
jgi:hypothetical protein